jgi:hypothetical protein
MAYLIFFGDLLLLLFRVFSTFSMFYFRTMNSNKPRLRGNTIRSNQDSQTSTVLEIPLGIKWLAQMLSCLFDLSDSNHLHFCSRARIRFKAFDDVFNGKTVSSLPYQRMFFNFKYSIFDHTEKVQSQSESRENQRSPRWLSGFHRPICFVAQFAQVS